MRKILVIALILLCIILFFTRSEEEEIRVRIIPNGDTNEDKKEKEEVKDVVLVYLQTIYDASYETMVSNIKDTYSDLENTLIELNYSSSVSFGYHTLYNKTYNDNAIKNTEAYTLYVVLGSGCGDNWWGSIYPKFLEVSGDSEMKYKSLFVEVFHKIKEN